MEALQPAQALTAVQAALQAARCIMQIYNRPQSEWQVEQKADHSPLTLADRSANELIVRTLSPMGIPVLSEETRLLPYEERRSWSRLWVVDPLDGTKEFIKRNGEFTVNIGLVEHGEPRFGVVVVPATECVYVGWVGRGAWRLSAARAAAATTWDELTQAARRLPLEQGATAETRVVVSRSHLDERTQAFINRLEGEGRRVVTVPSGSSIKICLLAEGTADVYPRFAPTSEWDTAAGHAVLAAAGGRLDEADTHEPLRYNKENVLNPSFVGHRPDVAATDACN